MQPTVQARGISERIVILRLPTSALDARCSPVSSQTYKVAGSLVSLLQIFSGSTSLSAFKSAGRVGWGLLRRALPTPIPISSRSRA